MRLLQCYVTVFITNMNPSIPPVRYGIISHTEIWRCDFQESNGCIDTGDGYIEVFDSCHVGFSGGALKALASSCINRVLVVSSR